MQTPAEKYLIQKTISQLEKTGAESFHKILNVGPGKSVVIEDCIIKSIPNMIADRVDVVECRVDHPNIGKCMVASIEGVPQLESDDYEVVFSNYVLEHVRSIEESARELYRLLKPGGLFVASIPNPKAPEFMISRRTSPKFHQFIKGKGEEGRTHSTKHTYKAVEDVVRTFSEIGFQHKETKYYSFVFQYLERFPVINYSGKVYDWTVNKFAVKRFSGNVCVIFQKPEIRDETA